MLSECFIIIFAFSSEFNIGKNESSFFIGVAENRLKTKFPSGVRSKI
jgi:hypothetical protein